MYYNVHFIDKLGKQSLVKYALTQPKWLQFWHCFHYKLFVILRYGTYVHHSWTRANLNKLIGKIGGLGVRKVNR
jgi:hypothetical protein